MITEIETAIAAYLTDALGADEALSAAIAAARSADPALPETPWVAKPATTITAAPKNKTLLAVAAASAPQSFPQLLEAMVHVYVNTPAEPAALGAMQTHFEQAVARAFSTIDHPTVEAEVADALHDRLPDWNGGGIYVTGWQPGREGGAFAPHFEVKIGLVRA